MGWKIYFACLTVLVVGSFIGRFFLYFKRPDVVKPFDLFQSIIGIIALAGFYGFVFQTRIAYQSVWISVSFLVIALWIAELFQSKNKLLLEKVGIFKAIALQGANALLTLPGYIGLVIYAFSQSLWSA